jgi:hypothetical protein
MSRERGRDGREFDRGGRLSLEKKLRGKWEPREPIGVCVAIVEAGEAPNDRGEPFEVDPAVQGNETWNKIRGNLFPSGYRTRNRILFKFEQEYCSWSNRGELLDSRRDVLIELE